MENCLSFAGFGCFKDIKLWYLWDVKYKNIPIKNIIDNDSRYCFLLGLVIYYLCKNKVMTCTFIQKLAE